MVKENPVNEMRGVQLMDASGKGSPVIRCGLLSSSILTALKLLQVLGKTFASYYSF